MATHKLEFSVTVSNPDGAEFYYEAHRMYPDDPMLAWLLAELDGYGKKAMQAGSNKDDGANLSSVLSLSIDGVSSPDVAVTGISYHELMKMEHEWHHIGAKLLKIGDDRAKGKK